MFEVHHGDALKVARGMEPKSVHEIVVSIPYWSQRDYDEQGQLGLEATPEEYVARVVEMFREFKRVLRDDGTLWLNMGDSYAGLNQGRGTEHLSEKQASNQGTRWMVGQEIKRLPPNLKPLNLCMIPARVAMALQADGWCLRGTVIWNKPNPMPESQRGWRWEKHRIKVGNRGRSQAKQQGHFQDHSGNEVEPDAIWVDCPGCEKCLPHGGLVLVKGSGRPTTSHEYIFLLSKTDNYFYDSEAMREMANPDIQRDQPVNATEAIGNTSQGDRRINYEKNRHKVYSRNMRSVWTFPAGQAEWEYCDNCHTLYTGPNRRSIQLIPDPDDPEPDIGKKKKVRLCPKCKSTEYFVNHFAAYPLRLPELCIKAGTSEKGVCPKCGAPWVRVVEQSRTFESGSGKAGHIPSGKRPEGLQGGGATLDVRRGPCVHSKTIDWLPSCSCDAGEPIPAVVWDPFCGSGQTGIAALKLGRSFVGIDLKREYCDVTKARLKELASQGRLI